MRRYKCKVDKKLDEWLLEKPDDQFPHTREASYRNRYERISLYLRENVHQEVVCQSILSEIEKGNVSYDQIIYLNNHGPGHVDQVIEHATTLLQNSECELSPYEGYLLLTAIHFHDVGNVYGRENHEKKCIEIMRNLGNLVGSDEPEKRYIINVAAAHGGNNNGNRDTIGSLEKEPFLLGQQVRIRLIASILRFADELADDRTRASRFFLKENRIPPLSELHHAYSKSLHTVLIHGSEIQLAYEFDKATALRKYYKSTNQVYLLDEIFDRTLKMHLERTYCMRFIQHEAMVQLERIRVEIKVSSTFDSTKFAETLESFDYSLEEKGYPEKPAKGIVGLCPDLVNRDGQSLYERLSAEEIK